MPTTLSVGPNRNVTTNNISASGNQSECTIAINPVFGDDTNLFAACNLNYYRVSYDHGVTWYTSNLAGIPSPGGDNQAVFDQFGNLFVTYLSGSSVRVVTSADGGYTFRLIGTFTGSVDQPYIAAGWGGPYALASVWVAWNLNGTMQAAGAPINWWNDIGAFSATSVLSAGSFGSIAVGPIGDVVVTYQNPSSGIGPSSIITRTDPDGLGPAAFGPVVNVGSTNVGGFAPIPAQPSRTIDSEVNLAYDYFGYSPGYNTVYMVNVDRPSTASNDTDIYVRISYNSGVNWTTPIRVNDDGSGRSQFNPAIAVDQVTGWVAVTWYDSRRSAANNEAEIWGTVSLDGGYTWEPNVQIARGLSSGIRAGSFNFGDYDLMDFNNGVFYRIWADNTSPSQLTPPNSSTTTQDAATARVEVIPGNAPGAGRTFRRPNSWPAPLAASADAVAATFALDRGEIPAAAVSLPMPTKGLPIALEAAGLPILDGLALEALGQPLTHTARTQDTTGLFDTVTTEIGVS